MAKTKKMYFFSCLPIFFPRTNASCQNWKLHTCVSREHTVSSLPFLGQRERVSQHFWGEQAEAAGTDSLLICQRRSKQDYAIFCSVSPIVNNYCLYLPLGKMKTQRLHKQLRVKDKKMKKKNLDLFITRKIYILAFLSVFIFLWGESRLVSLCNTLFLLLPSVLVLTLLSFHFFLLCCLCPFFPCNEGRQRGRLSVGQWCIF